MQTTNVREALAATVSEAMCAKGQQNWFSESTRAEHMLTGVVQQTSLQLTQLNA